MSRTALIADIGGTNARFGIVDADGTRDLTTLKCKDFAGPAEAAQAYLKKLGGGAEPEIGVFAVAGPILGDLVSLTSITWSFRGSKVREELGLSGLEVMNDFKAVALAVPGLAPGLLRKIGGGEPVEGQARGVIGPGTGLGVASLVWGGSEYIVQPGEGGHVTMPAKTQREFDIFQTLHVKYSHISAERVCSGKGLENLYNAIRELDGKRGLPDLSPAEISAKAMEKSCPVCAESLDLMLAFLGRISGNLALTLNAHGGIYIAGGIPVKLGDYFYKSRFLEEFRAKGRFSDYMKDIPVYMIRHDAIGLLGLEQRAQSLLAKI